MVSADKSVLVYIGDSLARYGFGEGHPFGPDRMMAFWDYACAQGIESQVIVCEPVLAEQSVIESFHTHDYVQQVIEQSKTGQGYLDYGDTPAFVGVYEAAAYVVGSTVDALHKIMASEAQHAFVPIAGLHHARRERAAGFCVFNDCGVAIEQLRREYGLTRIAYVDIDAHHGDGVFYAFEADPEVIFVDLHEDGRHLYPGTGAKEETGKGEATGKKLNLPMLSEADDDQFMAAWEQAEVFLEKNEPEFIIFQCGADSLAGDPITHLRYSEAAHYHAATRLSVMSNRFCQGRLLALGGGGYNRENLARAWTAVLQGLVGLDIEKSLPG